LEEILKLNASNIKRISNGTAQDHLKINKEDEDQELKYS
jgi:hypothetical protein